MAFGRRHDRRNEESQMTDGASAMMKCVRSLFALVFCVLAIPSLHAQTKKITAAEAKDHIGDRATVCGKVVSTE